METLAKVRLTICVWDFILGGVTLVFDSLAPYKGVKATL